MSDICIYSKPGCGKCEAAKKKMDMLGLFYRELDAMEHTVYHPGWRDDDSVGVTAVYQVTGTLPIFSIDGECMDYPSAMKAIKAAKETAVRHKEELAAHVERRQAACA